jgi:hypothetical protein
VAIQYKVPQNIDMQDRVVGPLTMVQFLYAVFGGGMGYISYSTLPSPLNLMLALLIGIFTVCVIFVKVNERPFLSFVGNIITFTIKPKVRVWSKSTVPFKVDVYQNPNDGRKKVVNQKNVSKSELFKLAETIDHHDPDHLLIKV